MPNKIRPCTLPAYWKAEEPIEACDIISFGFNWANDSILAFETVWKGQTSKNAYPELNLAELKDVKKWIDERYYSSDFESIDKADKEFLQLKYYRETAFLITEALNAPVLATDAVLAGLPKDAKIWKVCEDSLERCFISWYDKKWSFNVVDAHSTMTGGGYEVEFAEKGLCSTDRIQSNGCPKTAEYLRQFTLDGVRIKEKETSHD